MGYPDCGEWCSRIPDNQIIGQVVEEDVGFGPENMGFPQRKYGNGGGKPEGGGNV